MEQVIFRLKFYFITAVRYALSFINGGQNCLICGKNTLLLPVCKSCKINYFDVKKSLLKKRCSVCGKELISTENTCMECRENPVLLNTEKVTPLFHYRLWNKELLFLWKMQGYRALSYEFAKMIAEALTLERIEFIVPVPPRKGKIKKNGWDQINELCNFLCYFWGFKILNVLERNTSVQQKKLNRENRLETIESAYSFVGNKEEERVLKDFGGKFPEKVCIIDDVCTTGSTLECCARLLKEKKIKTVYAITLFTVD